MPKRTYVPQHGATAKAHPTAPCLPRPYMYGGQPLRSADRLAVDAPASLARRQSRMRRKAQPAPLWLSLLLMIAGTLLLTACGGNGSSNTPAATAPTSVAQTSTAAVNGPTPTPTIAQPTPVRGTAQTIMITDWSNGSYGFNPAVLAVKVGTTITWKNMSSAPHTVTSDDGQTFDSGNVAVGGSFHFTFTTVGTFSYHCNIHPYMRATMIVV